MRKGILLALATIYTTTTLVQAQTYTNKIVLTANQKITAAITTNSVTSMEMMDNKMEMKNDVTTSTLFTVTAIEKDGSYTGTQVVDKLVINFDGYGQKMSYNSADKSTHDNMIGQQANKSVNKTKIVKIHTDGTVEKTEDEEDKKDGMKKMMMSNMGGGDMSTAFLLIPKDVKIGDSWKKDVNENGLHTQTIYTLVSLNGTVATVATKERSKGTIKNEAQGQSMNIDLDNLSSGSIEVDITTGLVKTLTNKTEIKSKMNMMGKDVPSTGTTTVHITFQ